MRRCNECALVLPLDLFLGHNATCNLCLVSPRYRKPDPPAGEWRELDTVAKCQMMFTRQPKARPR